MQDARGQTTRARSPDWTIVAHEEAQKLPEEFREDFLRLVRTGEASTAFLDQVDQHPGLQRAAEAVFAAAAQQFEPMARALRGAASSTAPDRTAKTPELEPSLTVRYGGDVGVATATASATLATGVEKVVSLRTPERSAAIQAVGERLRRDLSGDERAEAQQVFETLQEAVAG
jgi:hypothetical protein